MSDSTSNVSSSSAVARLRRRRAEGGSSDNGSGTGAVTQTNRSGSAAGMFKMYSDDTPGLKVEPIVVLVLSLIFIASVFVLHIWGKYTRGA